MIVFAGPSLSAPATARWPNVDFRPPARQGDVYLAALERPAAIGLIDGYFEGVPAVWHKEILWALNRGIPVLGASSMGALRAAELDAFGMQGVGAIYQAYQRLEYTDDDEVALLHGPAELGYPVVSLAMVNLRATVRAADSAGVLDTKTAKSIVSTGKSQHYKARTWDTVIAAAMTEMTDHVADNLRCWIRENEVDQKQQDACTLLDLMIQSTLRRPAADFHFEETDLWVQATSAWQARQKAATSPSSYNLFEDKSFTGD